MADCLLLPVKIFSSGPGAMNRGPGDFAWASSLSGRGAGIRTRGLDVPNVARYRTAPLPAPTMDAVYVDAREAKGVVSIRPKAAFEAVLPAEGRDAKTSPTSRSLSGATRTPRIATYDH